VKQRTNVLKPARCIRPHRNRIVIRERMTMPSYGVIEYRRCRCGSGRRHSNSRVMVGVPVGMRVLHAGRVHINTELVIGRSCPKERRGRGRRCMMGSAILKPAICPIENVLAHGIRRR